jgi:CRISPR-associated protein Cmr4
MNLVYLYLLSPLHTGGTTQEGNLLGIARESHTDLPYVPSSSIRGRLRASESDRIKKISLFGPDLKDVEDKKFVEDFEMQTQKKLKQLEQGDIWVGDGSILWLPVPSLSHGVVWVSCPMLLRRWLRLSGNPRNLASPEPYETSLSTNTPVYLKDAILPATSLTNWTDWDEFTTNHPESEGMKNVLVLPDQHCATVIQMSLWRQVKVKLDEHKTVNGGFRYEEAIPPDTLMYFPWGTTASTNGTREQSQGNFQALLNKDPILQIGGQESLGRGFVQLSN